MTNPLYWFRKPQPAREVRFIQREASELRLDEWRKNNNLVAYAAKLLRDPNFRLLLDMLDNENPAHNVLALGVSPNDRIVHQSRIEGYSMSLNNLKAAAKPLLTKERVVATFEPESEQPNRR